MKKKVLALVLAVMMAVGCFAGLGAGVEADATSLYEQLLSSTTAEEFEAVASSASEEAVNALSEIELAAIQTHFETIAPESETISATVETVNFTQAGPFMKAVNVSPVRRMLAKAASTNDASSDLVTSKTAEAQNDGSYKIKIEAYATGKVSTVTSTTPVDVVLILDQSASMSFDFNGNKTANNTSRRQYAMKQAVKNFIDSVNAKYSEKSDHRISIVTFGEGATLLNGWTDVNTEGAASLKESIEGLPNSWTNVGTNTAAGVDRANGLFGNDEYSYTGANKTRQKVTILFTDGVPGTSGFDVSYATSAIKAAKSMKDSGVTVYSVGIFTGANVNQLYGDEAFFRSMGLSINDGSIVRKDVYCCSDGAIGSSWQVRNGFLSKNYEVSPIDVPAGNRFLNYLSSNFAGATEIGLKYIDEMHYGVYSYGGYEITKNFDRSETGYYLTADSSKKLDEIFKSISENIGNTNVTLGTDAKLKDVVTKYFDIASDVSAYTYDCTSYNSKTGAATWSDTGVKLENAVSIEGNTISVTGFDYAKNYVREKEVTGDNAGLGKKLVIEFTVTPKDGFAGGNNVPTNGTDSGIYNKDGELVKPFVVPEVNVPIKSELAVADKVIYKDQSESVDSLYTKVDTSSWKYDFVNVTYDVKQGENAVSGTVSPAECTGYTVTATFAPLSAGVGASGTPAAAATETKTATIHVLVPTVSVTATDVTKYYGEMYTPDGSNITATVTWSDKQHEGVSSTKPAPYTDADLEFVFDKTPFVVPNSDTVINFTVKANGTDITDKVQGNTDYTVLFKTCTLTINKDVADLHGANDSFIFDIAYEGNVEGFTPVQVVINGAGTATLTGLPIGTYTVKEDTDWSWRYTCDNSSASTTLSASKDNDSLTITNKLTENNWLGNETFVINKCESKTIEKVSFIQQAIDFLLGR